MIDNYPGFEAFYCRQINGEEILTQDNSRDYPKEHLKIVCDFFEAAPASSYVNSFRFEQGNLAKGVFFNSGNTGRDKFNDEFVTLKQATQLVASF